MLAYARRFDSLSSAVVLTPAEIHRGAQEVSPDVRRALRVAARHIRRVAVRQLPRGWRETVTPGVTIEQRVTPLDRVGCYVPGGRHPLPSSLLMTALPARVAGVQEIIVACPRPNAAVFAAAAEVGVTRLLRIGGAHAIAALAYGTRRVPPVDKIVGPGNAYVAAAKAYVAGDCAIDFYAGPTEIVILSRQGNPDWIAADLIAQAEHDPDARAILLTSSRRLARLVAQRVRDRTPADGPVPSALSRNGAIIVTRTLDEATDLANRIAPEHFVCDNDRLARAVPRAGTTFIGVYAAPAAGDYVTGSNHVLPTSGSARFRGGLSASDFVRVTSVQRLTRDGLSRLAPSALALARAEGLEHHAASIEVRFGKGKSGRATRTHRS